MKVVSKRHTKLMLKLGAVFQGLVLGSLVFVALLNLMRFANDAQIFSYQGF